MDENTKSEKEAKALYESIVKMLASPLPIPIEVFRFDSIRRCSDLSVVDKQTPVHSK